MDNKVHNAVGFKETLEPDKAMLPALEEFLDVLDELNKLSFFERKTFVKKLIEDL